MKRWCCLIFLMITLMGSAWTQSAKPSVMVQGKATVRSVKLRWAPNSPALWQMANKYGYTIERITVVVNNKILDKPVKTILNVQPLKPAAWSSWEAPADADDHVAVAAQAIFGTTFDVTQSQAGGMLKVINKAREQESRYSFALFSADRSIKAAQLSGLYYEDETVAPRTRYLYRVYANLPPEQTMKADTGLVYVGMQDYKPLPKPRDLKAEFKDHTVSLSWNGALLEKIYTSYWVERSENGRDFKSITQQPIVNTFQASGEKSTLIFRTDSLPINDKKFYYRVKGNDAFGETGPPSDTVAGAGRPAFAYNASITGHHIDKQGRVALQWTFSEQGEPLIKSFDLLRANPKTKDNTPVKTNIEKDKREVLDETSTSSNYYIIRVNDKYGRTNLSFPYFVQLEDSIPPAQPIGLSGRIDSLGRVYLQWEANTETDLSGYSIYRSNFLSDEYVQLPGALVNANHFTDTIRLNTLTEKIHYKIRASDNRFNASAFSDVLTLKKPDKIPPVVPVFTSYSSDSLGIHLQWSVSGSDDVVEHLLYRKENEETEWNLVKTFHLGDSASYYDRDVKHRTKYSYTLLAVDDDQLESPPAAPVRLKWIASDPYPMVEEIYYDVSGDKKSITLTWRYPIAGVSRFLIYKSQNGKPLTLFKTIEGTQYEMSDQLRSAEDKIEYRIMAEFPDGDRARISRAVEVKM